MRWFVVLWYTRRQSILFCWVAWCNMMCKLRADDAGGCDDHLCEPRPRVLSTLLEGSLPFWHRLHSRNPSHMSAGCEVFSHQRLVKPPTFIGSSSLCVINPSWGIAPILGLVEEHFTVFFVINSSSLLEITISCYEKLTVDSSQQPWVVMQCNFGARENGLMECHTW